MLEPQLFGRYLLIDRISTGGMAAVFLAKAQGIQGFEKVVAIKRILPSVSEDMDFTTMFIDEAKISASLSHGNIGQIFEFGQIKGQYYIAMEYIPGKDLRSIQAHLLDTGRVMEVPMALSITSRICQALDYAHRQNDPAGNSMQIVHRDVSPPNVIISYDGAVKLIDFGIAKAASRATRTRAGRLKGKFAYMSPEQVQGLTIDHRSDIFSLGILLFELITNQRLFLGPNQVATMNMVRRAEASPPSAINPDIPLEVDRIVLKALARDRESRYSWTSELRADIERYIARTGIGFDTSRLAQWMRSEFAGDLEAERKLSERVHKLQFSDAKESHDPEDDLLDYPQDTSQPSAERDDDQLLADLDQSPPAAESSASSETSSPAAEHADELENDTIVNAALFPEGTSPATEQAQTAVINYQAEEQTLASGMHLTPQANSPIQVNDAPESQADDHYGVVSPTEELSSDPPSLIAANQEESYDSALPTARADQAAGYQETAETIKANPSHIAPGPGRDAAVFGGALEANSYPFHQTPTVDPQLHVDVQGLEGAQIERYDTRPYEQQHEPVSAQINLPSITHRLVDSGRRLSSVQLMLLGAVSVVLLAGMVLLLYSLWGEKSTPPPPPQSRVERGSIIITTSPPAPCSVLLQAQPKGILQPGSPLSLTGIKKGRYQISIECADYQPYSTVVEVKEAEVSFVVATLQKKQ